MLTKGNPFCLNSSTLNREMVRKPLREVWLSLELVQSALCDPDRFSDCLVGLQTSR